MKIIKKILLSIITIILVVSVGLFVYDKATVNNRYKIGEKNLYIPIFVYHSIVDDESKVEYDYMQTTKDVFEKQIEGLEKSGYEFITYSDLEKYQKGEKALKKKSCIVTFDDGYESIYENVFPIAKEHNMQFTMFIITDNMGKEGVITWEQAKEMQDSGLVTIASHSIDHPEFTLLNTESAVANVEKSYEIIESNLGKQEPKVFTYPYGLHTEEQVDALEEKGYMQNLTDNKINKSNSLDLARLHRCYPLSDSPLKMKLKILYRSIRYN